MAEMELHGEADIQVEGDGQVILSGSSYISSGEEATSDGDFIKIEKETIDAKEICTSPEHVEEAAKNLYERDLMSISSTIDMTEQVKSLELRIEIVAKELKASKSEKDVLRSEVDLAYEKLDRAQKCCMELETDQKRLNNEILEVEHKHSKQLEMLHEALESAQAKDKELINMTKSFNALSAEMEGSSKKAEELELQLALLASEKHKFEEMCNEKGSHAELHLKRALETEEILELERLLVREAEDLLTKLQEEMNGLHVKITQNLQVEETLSRTSSELSEVQEKFEVSKLETIDLMKKLDSTQSVVEELTEALNLRKTSEEQLRADVQSLGNLLSTAKEDVLDKIAKLELVESKFQEEIEKRVTIEASLKSQEGQASDLKEELIKLRLESQTIERNLDELKENLSAANDLSTELEGKLNIADKNHENKNTQLSLALSQNEELVQKLSSLESLLEESKTSAEEAASQKNLELHSVIHASNATETKLKAQMKEVEMQLEASQKHKDKLDEELALTEQRSVNAHKKNEELEAEIIALGKASNEKERDLTDMLNTTKMEKQLFEDMSNNLSEKLVQANNLIEISKNDLRFAQDSLAKSEKDLEVFSIREGEILEKLKTAEEHLECHATTAEQATARSLELESLHQSLARDSDLKLNEMRASFTLKESEAGELQEKVSFLEDQVASYQSQAIEASERVGSFKTEIDSNEVKFIDFENTVNDLRQKVAESEVIAKISYSENELLMETNLKLNDELEGHQQKVDEFHVLLSSVQAEKDSNSEQLASHVKSFAVLDEEHSRGLAHHSATQSLLKETEAQLLEAREMFSQRDKEARELDEKMSALETQVRIHSEQAGEATTAVGLQKVQLEESALKLQNMERLTKEMALKATGYEADNEGLTKSNLKLSQELEKYGAKILELQVTLDDVIIKKETLSSHLDSSRKSEEDLSQQLASDREKLQLQISSIMAENNALDETLQNAKKELQRALAQMEEHRNEQQAKEISLTAELNILKADLTGKAVVEARIKELEAKLLQIETRHSGEIRKIQSATEERESKLCSELGEHTHERGIFEEHIRDLQKELHLAQNTIAAQGAEASDLKKVSESMNKLATTATTPMLQQVDAGFATAVVEDEPNVKSRELNLSTASPSKRKNKRKGGGSVAAETMR